MLSHRAFEHHAIGLNEPPHATLVRELAWNGGTGPVWDITGTYSYDLANGNLLVANDAVGQTTTYTYEMTDHGAEFPDRCAPRDPRGRLADGPLDL